MKYVLHSLTALTSSLSFPDDSMYFITISVALLLCFSPPEVANAGGPPLRLTQTISVPDVEGRIDHLAADVPGERLFVCALGNNSVEVIDLQKAERVHSITGLGAPQGIAYVPDIGRLYVANDRGGICNIYDSKSFTLLGSVDFKDDADNVRYEGSTRRIYVGYGKGRIGLIDADKGESVGSIKLSGHPEAFLLQKQGLRIFVNIPTAHHVAIINRAQGKVIATWKTDGAFANFPMALDESGHRLFVGCRFPAKVVVLNTDSGSFVKSIAISGDTDDIFYDEKRHRLYAICGDGNVKIIDQLDRDTYKIAATIQTRAGARTGLFVPELNSLFVAVPHRGNQSAEIRRYAVE
jgi:DNA-binding beta-propeller fold protein YncE